MLGFKVWSIMVLYPTWKQIHLLQKMKSPFIHNSTQYLTHLVITAQKTADYLTLFYTVTQYSKYIRQYKWLLFVNSSNTDKILSKLENSVPVWYHQWLIWMSVRAEPGWQKWNVCCRNNWATVITTIILSTVRRRIHLKVFIATKVQLFEELHLNRNNDIIFVTKIHHYYCISYNVLPSTLQQWNIQK